MKRNLNRLIGFAVGATDGEIGKIKEVYFDDATWTIRYFIVETGNWLVGRKVLISPEAALVPNWEEGILPVDLTKEQVKNSPDIDTEQPVSRQQEIALYAHYPWTSYWGAGSLWGGGMGTSGMVGPAYESIEEAVEKEKALVPAENNTDPHLRSSRRVTGYQLDETDGQIGEVADFIIDENTWKIEFLVVDTGAWFSGDKVLVSPEWIKEINWETSSLKVRVSKEQIKNSPEYDDSKPFNESYAAALSDYYQAK